jgi:hypothetical protein
LSEKLFAMIQETGRSLPEPGLWLGPGITEGHGSGRFAGPTRRSEDREGSRG